MSKLLVFLLLAAGAVHAQPRDGESDEDFEIRLRATYSKPCNEAGYKPFTDEHNKCIIVLYRKAQADHQRRAAAQQNAATQQFIEGMARNNAAATAASQQMIQNAMPRPAVNCTTTYLGGVAQTTCR